MPVAPAHDPPRQVHRPKVWTAADLEAAPERTWPRFEVIDGVLYCDGQPADSLDEMAPAPHVFYHQQPLQRLALALMAWFEAHPDWVLVLSPADLKLASGRMVQPDLFVLRREDYQAYAAQPEPPPSINAVPVLVAEVLSKRTASYDRNEKRRVYAEHGVAELWLVDARARRVEQYVLDGERYGEPDVADEGQRVLSGVLDDGGEPFGIDVARLFEP